MLEIFGSNDFLLYLCGIERLNKLNIWLVMAEEIKNINFDKFEREVDNDNVMRWLGDNVFLFNLFLRTHLGEYDFLYKIIEYQRSEYYNKTINDNNIVFEVESDLYINGKHIEVGSYVMFANCKVIIINEKDNKIYVEVL